MSKRSRRYRNPNRPQEAFNSPVAAPSASTAAVSGSGSVAAAVPQSRRVNWQEEYSEVLGDLRKTAIIAVVLVAVMVGLSFVIR